MALKYLYLIKNYKLHDLLEEKSTNIKWMRIKLIVLVFLDVIYNIEKISQYNHRTKYFFLRKDIIMV